jgi:PAS domain S-box-containing protein
MMIKADKQKFAWELLDTFPDAIELFELDGTILYVNKAATKLHDNSSGDLVGANIWSLYPPGQAAHRKTVVNKAITLGTPIQFTDRSDEKWLEVLIRPLVSADGKIESVVTYMHDITRQIRAEERLKLVSLQLLTNQEDERRRIAQDLHDDLGQSMTALILTLKAIHSDVVAERRTVGEQIKGAIRVVEDMMRHIRQVLYELRPPSFETTSPTKVLEELCSSLALSTGLRAVFSSQEQLPPMSNAQATALYRLVQEGMNNAAKHAKATSVWINLEYVDGEVIISFEDDGEGFEPSQRVNYGIGLDGLQERFGMLNGNFDIESAPGKGTRLYGSLPINNSNTG